MGDQMKYEERFLALNDIIKALETGQTPLHESLKLFEEGIQHYRICSEQLEEAQTKVKVLMNQTLLDFNAQEE